MNSCVLESVRIYNVCTILHEHCASSLIATTHNLECLSCKYKIKTSHSHCFLVKELSPSLLHTNNTYRRAASAHAHKIIYKFVGLCKGGSKKEMKWLTFTHTYTDIHTRTHVHTVRKFWACNLENEREKEEIKLTKTWKIINKNQSTTLKDKGKLYF